MSASMFTPTDEQARAVAMFTTGENLVIEAGAGSGKTSTLRLLADAAGARRGLYLAFNKAIQLEAARTFGPNIEARTAHSLAYQAAPGAVRDRLNLDRQTYTEQAELVGLTGRYVKVLGINVGLRDMMMTASGAVRAFCLSGDQEIASTHITIPRSLKAFSSDTYRKPFLAAVLDLANRIWDDAASTTGKLKLTHDHLLKMWGLSAPTLAGFDYILLDEGQDADQVVLDVVQHQPVQTVVVGDSAQAIYGWRMAVDSLDKFDGNRARLTRSWRFGEDIAAEANMWLSALGSDMRISGDPARSSTVGRDLSHLPDVVLCRTNGGVVHQVIRAQERNIAVALAGKDTGRKVRDLAVAAGKLQHGQWQSHPDLLGFKTWAEVQRYVEDDPAGSDIAVLVKLVDTHGAERLVAAVDACVPAGGARVAVSTAHTAKGLEWGRVRIDEDFPLPRQDRRTGETVWPAAEEMMLAYVAITRAREHLDPRGLEWIHSHPEAVDGPRHRDEVRNAARDGAA